MTAFSKFFQENIQTKTCQSLLHSETCGKHVSKDILLYMLSNFKYFAPICLLPALVSIRTINKKVLQKILKFYMDCSLFGFCLGYSTNFLICFLRKLCGQFGVYSFVYIPTFLSANILYWGPTRVINLFETSIFQCSIETFFLMRRNIVSRTISNSRILQTWIFMICSAIILHGKQMYNIPGFWFLTPNPRIQRIENVECEKCELHSQSNCWQYLLDGMREYFIMGLSLDSIKMLTSKVNSSQNHSKVLGKLKNFRLRTTTLLTIYISIYRFLHCWLNRNGHNTDDLLNHILSSFLAGSCFYLYPQSTLFSFALIQAIRTIGTIFKISNTNNQNKILKFILEFPYGRMLYPFALASMVNLICVRPQYVGRLGTAIANGLTNNYAGHISKEVRLLWAMDKS